MIAFTAGLIACGGPDTSGQDCEPTEPCLDSQGPGTNEQPLPCGDASGCGEEPPPDGGGSGTTLYSELTVIVKNHKATPYEVRFTDEAYSGWPAQTIGKWDSGRFIIAPGESRVFEKVLRVPRGTWNSATFWVWEDANNYSGRGFKMELTSASATCIADVLLEWPNAAGLTCTNN